MLGRYVTSYFQQEAANDRQYEVISINREDNFDVTKLSSGEIFAYLGNAIGEINPSDVIINCIGLIKQKKKVSEMNFLQVNSMFPWTISDFANGAGCNIIHPSTDCVYDGKEGNYDEFFPPNPEDIYGMSKALADSHPMTIIRTSIIGEELHNKLSFIEWAKSQTGKEVDGYTNHMWNGITCLQWVKLVQIIIDEGSYWTGIRHISSPESYSKYTMLTFLDEVYDLNLTIKKHKAKVPVDRTLSSFSPYFDVPDLRTQMKELKDFNLQYEPPVEAEEPEESVEEPLEENE